MSNIILVGFELQLRPDLMPVPQWDEPKSYSGAKLMEWRDNKQAELLDAVSAQPYTATFKTVTLFDARREADKQSKFTWKAEGRGPGEGKLSIALAVRAKLLELYPDTWPYSLGAASDPSSRVVFVGFQTRLFLKVLGIECSLPENQVGAPGESYVLPLSMWYDNHANHRDIEHAVIPSDYSKYLTWDVVLQSRGLRESFADWNGPLQNAEQDLSLSTVLAAQLGMFLLA